MVTQIQVYPIGDKWMMVQFNRFEAFMFELAMFGLAVAASNLLHQLLDIRRNP